MVDSLPTSLLSQHLGGRRREKACLFPKMVHSEWCNLEGRQDSLNVLGPCLESSTVISGHCCRLCWLNKRNNQ